MVFLKNVGERVVLFDERLNFVRDYPEGEIIVGDDTIVIMSKGTKALELPKSQTGILFL